MSPRKKTNNFDVIIVGAGPAGLFAAHHLANHTDLAILVLEKGRDCAKRRCPAAKAKECLNCTPCNILSGIGGAGLFSDGKLNFIPKLGKTDLTQFLSRPEAQLLIDETEAVFNSFGMDGPVYPTDLEKARELRKNAKRFGIDLMIIKQKHLGSNNLPIHIANMTSQVAAQGVRFQTGEEVIDIIVDNGAVTGVTTARATYLAPRVILAPGRVGAQWVMELANRYGIHYTQRGIEVGVRVEIHKDIMQDLTDIIYDPTFFIQTGKYDDQTRTFCTNKEGYVSQEKYQEFTCVNGHAYTDRKSENTNFAFLSKVVLTEPVSDNQAYGQSIGRLATIIGGGRPILQRYGDLKRGRRSTWNRICKSSVEPTLKNVTCGDIAMALPSRIVENLIDGIEKLNQVVAGVANEETLLYAPEIKFFATQLDTSPTLETSVSGLFVAGDGPGVAGNIVSAAATGILAAEGIITKGAKR